MINEHNAKLLIEEIKLIQEIIKRMANNSFLIKGWSITITTAILIAKGNEKLAISDFSIFIPISFFWYLDAFYLHQERLYRKLHGWVVDNRPTSEKYLFDFSTSRFKDTSPKFFYTLVSKTLLIFYVSLLLISFAISRISSCPQ